MFIRFLRSNISDHILAFKSRKMFYQKVERQTTLILLETIEDCVGQEVHGQNIYLPSGTLRTSRTIENTAMASTFNCRYKCSLSNTHSHAFLPNCCVDKNSARKWLAPWQVPTAGSYNHIILKLENDDLVGKWFPHVISTWGCRSPGMQCVHTEIYMQRVLLLPLVRTDGRAVWHANVLMSRKC